MRVLAIELGSWSVKAVETESRFRKFEILDFHEARLPLRMDDPKELYKEAIAQILAKLPSHPDKLVCSLPAPNLSMRFLNIPVKQKKKAEQMYQFELEDSLPFKLEDTVVQHQIYPQKDSCLVFAAIAPNRFITNHLEYLKTVGIDPDWLTFDGMGLINLFGASLAQLENQPSGPTLIADIGHSKTIISIIDEGRIEAFRCFGWGGMAITKNIAITTGDPLEQAEDKKHQLDIGSASQGGEVLEATRQSLGFLLTELNHSLIAYRNSYKKSISAIKIAGGTGLLKGLPEFLSKQFGGVPCEVFSPANQFQLKEELRSPDSPRFVEPWGRANVFSRKSPLLFNFRRSGFGKQTSLAELSTMLKDPNVIKLTKYVTALALILFVHVTASSYFAGEERDKANEELKKVFQDTFRNAPKALKNTITSNPVQLKEYIEKKNKELDEKLKMLSKSRESMISYVKKITNSFPANVKVDVNKMEITDRNLVMEGVLYQGDLTTVTENLKKLPILSELTVTNEGQRFVFKAKVLGR